MYCTDNDSGGRYHGMANAMEVGIRSASANHAAFDCAVKIVSYRDKSVAGVDGNMIGLEAT